MRIASVVGARPQFIKLAPLASAIQAHSAASPFPIEHVVIHTGQHYDHQMDAVFFTELGIPPPDHHLGVGSGSHGRQTGEMIARVEDVLVKEKPDIVVVFGDTNSTLAGAVAAAKLRVPVAHVEAGLRSFNRNMPEEINRVLTDHCSDVLFCPTRNAAENLQREGLRNCFDLLPGGGADIHGDIGSKNLFPVVVAVGDIMYDLIIQKSGVAEQGSDVLDRNSLVSGGYFLLTLHRSENVDNRERLEHILAAMCEVHASIAPVVFPIHPRTKKALSDNNSFQGLLSRMNILDPPLGYFDMLVIEKNAKKIFTDSGGVQKEAFFFRVPCITLREETEWPETIEAGANILVGSRSAAIVSEAKKNEERRISWDCGSFGGGDASQLIVQYLSRIIDARRPS